MRQLNTTIDSSLTLNQTNRPQFVSDNYAFIKSRDIIDTAMQLGFEPVSIKQSRARSIERVGFEKHQIILRHPDFTDGESELRLYFRNSHDRTSALQLDIGFFRFICENGLIIGDALFPSLKVYHVGNSERIQGLVADSIQSMIKRIPAAMELKNKMQGMVLEHEQLLALASESADVVSEIRKATVSINSLVEVRRSEDQQLNAWTAFNVIQENALGKLSAMRLDGTTGLSTRVHLRKIKDLDKDTKINKTLFDVFAKQLQLGKVG